MGRGNCKKLALFIFFATVTQNLCFAQTNIYGNVKGHNELLQSASILLKDSTTIVAYTYTNSKGTYSLKTTQIGTFTLMVSSLGYESKNIPVQITSQQKELNIDIDLKERTTTLNEVIINAERPITIKKDTIVFKTSYFTNGTEETVEDLLCLVLKYGYRLKIDLRCF